MITQTMDLNEFQAKNILLLSADILKKLKSNDWTTTPSPLMACVQCGGGISTPIMKFFNWDGRKFKCYKCQNKINY